MDGDCPVHGFEFDPDAYEAGHLLLVGAIAKEFGVLPSVVERDLEEDPDQVSMNVLPLMRYAEAKSVNDLGKSDIMKDFRKRGKANSDMLDRVILNAHESAELQIKLREEEA